MDMEAFLLKHNATKHLATKLMDTYQEPRQHSYNTPNKNNNLVYFVSENKQIDPAFVAPERPWKVWDMEIDGPPPQAPIP